MLLLPCDSSRANPDTTAANHSNSTGTDVTSVPIISEGTHHEIRKSVAG